MRKVEKYGFDDLIFDRLVHYWQRIQDSGAACTFESRDDFLLFAGVAGYEDGCVLKIYDENGAYSPENIYFEKTKCSREELAKQWDDFIAPIRERYKPYLKPKPKKTRQFWQYEHPDLEGKHDSGKLI